jgi:nucleotide-binding universal stress UspA family protein
MSDSVEAKVVVGVDGSEASRHALSWAAEEARLRGARLVVVHAWTVPVAMAAPGLVPVPLDPEEWRAEAEQLLEREVDETLGADPGLPVERLAVPGSSAGALVDAAEGADLLVVGSRGHGGFAGLLLGSVSQQCAHHAPCPVVIVR